MSQHNRLPIAMTLFLLTTLTLGGCHGSGSSNPTAPMGPLLVRSSGTATQIEPNGFRVQVRLDVTSGLGALSQASSSGAAQGQVCLSGSCDDDSLSTVFSEGVCAGLPTIPAGSADLGIAAAWISGDAVGIDFCVENLTAQATFETTVTDGSNRSNVVRTTCTPNVTCFSG